MFKTRLLIALLFFACNRSEKAVIQTAVIPFGQPVKVEVQLCLVLFLYETADII